MNRREFVLGGAGLAAAEPQDPPGFKLGVVDLRACFDANRYARVKEVAAELAAARDRYAREIQKLRKDLAEHNDMLATLAPNSELYVDRVRKAGHAEYDIKVLQEIARRRARDLGRDLQSRLYTEILRVTRIVGDRLKLDLVVKEGEPKLAEDDGESLAMLTREVLHHRNAVDITSAVIDQLNADWAVAWLCERCKLKVAPPACPDCGARRR